MSPLRSSFVYLVYFVVKIFAFFAANNLHGYHSPPQPPLFIHRYHSPCQKCQPSASHRVFVGELVEGLADRRDEVERYYDRQKNYSDKNSLRDQCVITQPDQPPIFRQRNLVKFNTNHSTYTLSILSSSRTALDYQRQQSTAQHP